jgi:hypothetical protein
LCFAGGSGSYFFNDSTQIWYLFRNRHHKYEWVDSKDGQTEPFAIEYSEDNGGFKMFIGRIVRKDKPAYLGPIVSVMGVMYYVDDNGASKSATSGYQVLTCKSCKKEKKIPVPSFTAKLPPNVDTGCSELLTEVL